MGIRLGRVGLGDRGGAGAWGSGGHAYTGDGPRPRERAGSRYADRADVDLPRRQGDSLRDVPELGAGPRSRRAVGVVPAGLALQLLRGGLRAPPALREQLALTI